MSVSSTKSNEVPTSTENVFLNTDNFPINHLQFKYIFENVTNKSLNIYALVEEVNKNMLTLINLIEKILLIINDRSTKTRLTRMSNLLFQAFSLQEELTHRKKPHQSDFSKDL